MRKLCILLLSMMLSAPLAAIGFGYHVFEVRTEPEFSNGVFPTSVMYQFNFPMPDFINGRSTILAFRLDNGLAYRNLRQSPCDGSILARNPVSYPTEYTVLFDEFNLFFAQGFMETRDEKKDLLEELNRLNVEKERLEAFGNLDPALVESLYKDGLSLHFYTISDKDYLKIKDSDDFTSIVLRGGKQLIVMSVNSEIRGSGAIEFFLGSMSLDEVCKRISICS